MIYNLTVTKLPFSEETVGGIHLPSTVTLTEDDDNWITQVSHGPSAKNYSYDSYGRVATKTARHYGNNLVTENFVYCTPTATNISTTSNQVRFHNITGVLNRSYVYPRDENGNIQLIYDGTNNTNYVYDSANQLIRENNQAGNFTHVWTYDSGGNILSRTEYAYTAGALGTATDTVSYTYGNNYFGDLRWDDLLTSYDGNTVTTDTIGNMLSDGTRTYTWKQGRQLATLTQGSTTWTYTYNADGLRTKRTDGTNTYTYIYGGGKLTRMTAGSNTLTFCYDANGLPYRVNVNGMFYYYVTNLQGDVIALIGEDGTVAAEYTYDAWGNILSITGPQASAIGTLNPLRYRSYIYDNETQLYYLQSRYYNPELGRFINADVFASTGQGLLGNNMFAYCNNNPTNFSDSSGHMPIRNTMVMTSDSGLNVQARAYRNISQLDYVNNAIADSMPSTTTRNKLINDQNGTTGKVFKYGLYSAQWNACEAIAVHNAKVLLNKESTLSSTMRDFQTNGAMIGYGYFGSNPFAIGKVLDYSNIPYSTVRLSEMTQPGIYIISFWNNGLIWEGLHTVAVYYNGIGYTTYNLKGSGLSSDKNPFDYASSYICGYYLG